VSDFAALGLRSEIAMAAAALFDTPSPIQRAAIPVLRRGGNALLLASSGSGVTAAYALALLDRLSAPSSDAVDDIAAAGDAALRPRVLVLAPTEERAARIASTFVRLAGGLPVPVRAMTAAWSGRGDGGVLVAPLETATRALRESSLKLDHLIAVVFDHADTLLELAGSDAFEGLAASLPHDAQRIITAGAGSRAIEQFVEAHARRALTIPARITDTASTTPRPPEPAGPLSCIVVTEAEKPAALARVLRRPRPEPPLVLTRSSRRAHALADAMRARGFIIAEADDARTGVDAVIAPADSAIGTPRIAADVPFDAATLLRMDTADGLVLVVPDELAHVRRIAAEANVALEMLAARAQRGSVAAYRDAIRNAIREQDLDAQIELLGPLFDEYAAVEIAAALGWMVRTRETTVEPAAPEPQAGRPPAFVRLFVSIGARDNIRPGDLLGAITGEASVAGDQVGRIDIRDTFTVVEVASDVSERVIRALNGTTLRGRALRVDYDRKKVAQRPLRTSRPPRS
jgi:ATP-dependent RNA helicase DeaD